MKLFWETKNVSIADEKAGQFFETIQTACRNDSMNFKYSECHLKTEIVFKKISCFVLIAK
jgi:hypothetical protein